MCLQLRGSVCVIIPAHAEQTQVSHFPKRHAGVDALIPSVECVYLHFIMFCIKTMENPVLVVQAQHVAWPGGKLLPANRRVLHTYVIPRSGNDESVLHTRCFSVGTQPQAHQKVCVTAPGHPNQASDCLQVHGNSLKLGVGSTHTCAWDANNTIPGRWRFGTSGTVLLCQHSLSSLRLTS